jgi:hypothetical protein
MLQSPDELRLVRDLLKRRFPETFSVLASCLEQADPCEVVYPGNPGEYDDVVREIIVLLAPSSGRLGALTIEEIEDLLRDGLARCFGEPVPDERIRQAAELVASSVKN